jgi:hypothetical protein
MNSVRMERALFAVFVVVVVGGMILIGVVNGW